jgi:hypothetical protein
MVLGIARCRGAHSPERSSYVPNPDQMQLQNEMRTIARQAMPAALIFGQRVIGYGPSFGWLFLCGRPQCSGNTLATSGRPQSNAGCGFAHGHNSFPDRRITFPMVRLFGVGYERHGIGGNSAPFTASIFVIWQGNTCGASLHRLGPGL